MKFIVLPTVLCIWLSFSPQQAQATEYFVSGIDGYDYNPGTIDRPWQHIWRAALALHPGDICTIRGGEYFEDITLSGLQGTKDKSELSQERKWS